MLNRIIKKMRIIFSNNDNYIKLLRKSGVKIGEECEIYKDVVFGSEPYLIEIGDHVRITNGCKFITHDGGVWVIRQLMDDNEIDLFGKIIVGNNVHIGMNCIIMPNVKIGNNVCISQGAMLLCGNHNYKKTTFDLIIGNITLENGTWIGAHSIVCPGVTLHSHSVLGVASVANHDMESYSIYQGNPAKKIRIRTVF